MAKDEDDNLEWQRGVLGVDPKLVNNDPKTTDVLVARLEKEHPLKEGDMPLKAQVSVLRNVIGEKEMDIQALLLRP